MVVLERPTNTKFDFLYKEPNGHLHDASQSRRCHPIPFRSSDFRRYRMFLHTAPLASLFFFPSFAVSAIYAPECSTSWKWVCFHHAFFGRCLICWHCVQAFNSLGQNPCMVAAYLISTCSGGCEFSSLFCSCVCKPCRLVFFAAFTINSLAPGYHYTGPSGSDNTDLCKCNTVAYSLISACDACQGADWISYGFPSSSSFHIS
jgi:hypothetical protein